MASLGGGLIDVARLLLAYGVYVDAQDEHCRTLLHFAVEYFELVLWLLEHVAGVDLRDGDGCTPLHTVSLKGQVEVVRSESLLDHDADVHARNWNI